MAASVTNNCQKKKNFNVVIKMLRSLLGEAALAADFFLNFKFYTICARSPAQTALAVDLFSNCCSPTWASHHPLAFNYWDPIHPLHLETYFGTEKILSLMPLIAVLAPPEDELRKP